MNWYGVESSNVEAIAYHHGDIKKGSMVGILSVKFIKGGIYHYMDVPEELYQELSCQSRKKNISLSELIRQRISFKVISPVRSGQAILNDLVKQGEKLSWKGAPKDLSRRIDEVVYG